MEKYYQTSTDDNLRAVVATLLHTQQINILTDTIETEIVTNNNYPSLDSARSALNTWGVPNMPVRIGMAQLASAPLPAIAHLHSGVFVLVQAVGKDSVQYWDTAKGNKEASLQEFEQIWSGAMLLVSAKDAQVPAHLLEKSSLPPRLLVQWVLGLCCLGVLGVSVASVSWYFAGLACLKALGLFFSMGLLSTDWGAGQWISGICNIGKQTDCKSVLQTKASKIFSWLSWSEMGFFYFAGGLLALLFASWQASSTAVLPILSLLTLLALPYTFFSVYYQARIAKQWCPLCLGVQGVFWLEFVLFLTSFQTHLQSGEGLTSVLGSVVVAFSLPILGWFSVADVLKNANKAKHWRLQALRLQRNPAMFQAYLQQQKRLQSTEGLGKANTGITLGNPDAEVEIVMFTNPHCNPCTKVHKDLEELLEWAGESVKVRLYFLSFPQREKTTQELLTLCLSAPDNQTRQAILHAWFEQKQKTNTQPTDEAEQMRQIHVQYANLNAIEGTPTIFVQGFQLPQVYQLQELRYHVESLQNFDIATN